MNRLSLLLRTLLLAVCVAPLAAQAPGRLSVEPQFVPAKAKPGDEVVLELRAEIDEGFHVYGSKDATEPTHVKFTDLAGLEAIGEPEVPPGEEHTAYGITNYWVTGSPVLKQRLRVPKDAVNGALRVAGQVEYLACTPEYCEMAAKERFTAKLTIEGGADKAPAGTEGADGKKGPDGKAPTGDAAAVPSASLGNGVPGPDARGSEPPPVLRQPKFAVEDGGEDLNGSLWQLMLLCLVGGLIALVMPCTYPMIPITFSFFTKQADARGGKVLPLAIAYGTGIVGIFVLIGVVVGEVITVFAVHWLTNLVIGGAFVVFALSLFGWILLQPPAFVNRLAGRAGKAGGLLGVFLMGATLVVTSFTCTAPIVGSLLASVGSAGRGRVALGMAVFGLTMAAPFVALALLPGRVKQLPRSGEWMNTLKVSLGFVELAAALKFFSNVDIVLAWGILPREVFLMAWALLFTLLALFLFGLFAPRGEPLTGVSTARNGGGVLSLVFAFFCLAGASGLPLGFVMTAFEPNYQLRAVAEHEIVTDDHVAAMQLARREHKYVLVNFTGFT